MYDPNTPNHHNISKRSSYTNLASCLVATTFLILLAVATTVVYFVTFKPKPPKIVANSHNSQSLTTVNFTFYKYVSVTNPNRDSFTHYDSSLQLAYYNAPVGFIFIPPEKLTAGGLSTCPLSSPEMTAVGTAEVVPESGGPTIEIETMMKLVGRVRVLKVFAHRVISGVNCGVAIQVSSGSMLGLHC